jgi:uncharacterized protein HemX
VSKTDLLKIEERVNQLIAEEYPVQKTIKTLDQAKAEGATASLEKNMVRPFVRSKWQMSAAEFLMNFAAARMWITLLRSDHSTFSRRRPWLRA